MDRSIAAQFRHRLVSYALVATLLVGATIAPSVSEARSPEERTEAVGKSGLMNQDYRGTMAHWLAEADGKVDAQSSSFQSWLADLYNELVGLKAAIRSAISHSWKWSHGKSDNTCR
jgi:hypothetical protein